MLVSMETSLQLLLVCCCCSVEAAAGGITVGGYSCVSAYWDSVTCVLNITGHPVGQFNTSYSLTFMESEGVFSCPLVAMELSYRCVCKVTKDSENLSNFHQYDIKLCRNSVCQNVTHLFEPSQNIQPTPPRQPEIREAPETFNITWRSGYEGHRYLKGDLDYELLLQTQSTGTRISRLKSLETSASVPRSRLPPGATLCIKVRSKPNNKRDYGGTWSEWSPSTCRENKAGKEDEDNRFVVLIRSLGPVCAVVGVTLFVLRRPAVRMKIETLSHTPTPAPFFQPLFQQHGGNLQKWLSPQGKMELTYKTEEVLTADAVIVEPKPVTTDPEENRAFHNPTVPLGFTQCQSSYVGLPGVHWASPPPVPTVSPGETSHAAPPRPVWGVDVEEVEVVSALPADVFNTCSSDSGCSFEEPTQSPECSSPNRPPPPCFCNDYCVLNKTAGGFAPVLVSGGSGPGVPTGSLQEE
ncbi:interleukin-21 receptor-like [Pseudoliparis swirei]|uniref:interleukin-21 receptor-like n=1 Tax=Pseudoliparis swirei TaxID=2059687 RepID=UPI0024BDD352|nr:interleukin-21 receptor-like [Pseudoliparis swirei]XP_056261997.1 interleukin-21 receptor-like [Pseudoliparis swirei]XP_056261998.1 interleukin-21 receptor-like [Pseudoliparis swirei]